VSIDDSDPLGAGLDPGPAASATSDPGPAAVAADAGARDQTGTAGERHACPACGAGVLAGERFCEACGAALTGVQAPAPPPVPPELVRRDAGAVARASSVTVPLTRCATCGELASMGDGYCSICGMRAASERDHGEAAGAGWAGVSDRGQHHARNEDAFVASSDGHRDAPDGAGTVPGRVLVALADGVSTTQRPDDASLACVGAVHDALLRDPEDLIGAAAAGREAVLGVEPTGDPALGPPSCTLLTAVVDDAIDLAWLGDCRAYWLDDEVVEVLTTDHSWAAEEVAAGLRSEEQALEDPRAHMITRWVGADADPAWVPATRRITPTGPGHLVLCSDGLWNYFGEPEALRAATGPLDDLLVAANRLVTFANGAGGHDNITVVIVPWPVRTDAPSAPDPVAAPAAATIGPPTPAIEEQP
jgi:serine/threonine protein phosphatase PrpC